MADASRESPLHAFAGDVAVAGTATIVGEVTITERPFRAMFNARGKPGDATFVRALGEATGLELPGANAFIARDGRAIAWLGPNEFLLLVERGGDAADAASKIRGRLGGQIRALTEVSAGHTTIQISGGDARSFLARGCALDLHPRALNAGQCLQTLVAGTSVLLLLRDDSPRFEIIVRRSFADHLWRWLKRSAQH